MELGPCIVHETCTAIGLERGECRSIEMVQIGHFVDVAVAGNWHPPLSGLSPKPRGISNMEIWGLHVPMNGIEVMSWTEERYINILHKKVFMNCGARRTKRAVSLNKFCSVWSAPCSCNPCTNIIKQPTILRTTNRKIDAKEGRKFTRDFRLHIIISLDRTV